MQDLRPGLAITHCGNTRRDHLPPTLATYEQGVRGNTQMMMMDLNNLQVADWILAWVESMRRRNRWR